MTFSPAHITALATHPVKGLTAHPLQVTTLQAKAVFPLDRAYAIENGPCGFDATAPKHIAKNKFLVLARFADVAQVKCTYDLETKTVTLSKPAAADVTLSLDTKDGQEQLAAYFTEHMGNKAAGPLKVLHCDNHAFTDTAENLVHVVNLASVKALSQAVGTELDPKRFRANIYVEGLPAYEEFNWEDKKIRSSSGVEFRFVKKTRRCAAIDVNPDTAERDTNINKALYDSLGHTNVGIYLELVNGGVLSVGDTLIVE
ncbi:MOSC domain protein [Pseudovibrio axinellae]|uniref:MOSC domain protein n=1 Tax=Pseudovibrio axinellae TaxID=989403 RepID=A0A165WIM6_9HYPH|nr:MOSC domain-containing protein [Pseudovibrio axinellae]KZL16568.1 MOSC domain protein [Pseudovibrio axinellae]SEQ15404.1 hypothetical protein SAMN05421798_1024 [Pseudovibrio axinellae]